VRSLTSNAMATARVDSILSNDPSVFICAEMVK